MPVKNWVLAFAILFSIAVIRLQWRAPWLEALPQRRPFSLRLHSRRAYPPPRLGHSPSAGCWILLVDRSWRGNQVPHLF